MANLSSFIPSNLTFSNVAESISQPWTFTDRVDFLELEVQGSQSSNSNARIYIDGSRTSCDTCNIARIEFKNQGTTRALISAQDPAANSSLGRGRLIFQTVNNGGALTTRLTIDQNQVLWAGVHGVDGNRIWSNKNMSDAIAALPSMTTFDAGDQIISEDISASEMKKVTIATLQSEIRDQLTNSRGNYNPSWRRGGTALTTSRNTGWWVGFGDMIFAHGYARFSSTPGSGDLQVTLPFNLNASPGGQSGSNAAAAGAGWYTTTGEVGSIRVEDGSNVATFFTPWGAALNANTGDSTLDVGFSIAYERS